MRAYPILLVATLSACEIERKSGGDSTAVADSTAADSVAASSASPVSVGTAIDSGAAGVATPPVAGGTDSVALEVTPEDPRRGGLLFARVRGVGGDAAPRCTWKGRVLPCYVQGTDAIAIVPLPADEEAGSFSLVIEAAGRRLARQVLVADRQFGRELVFLDARTHALARDTRAIARDGRAVRAVLAGESPERRWRGAWREPGGGRSSGYGVERFYYRASDSSRAISVPADARTRGSFGADTSSAAPAAGAVPAWRHAGVDHALAKGTRVEAPAAAIVADVGDYHLTGRTLLLDHGQGVFTALFHLDTITVRRGDVVRAGQSLARVGTTGLSTGPHLHYGVYVHGADVDPAAWRAMPSWLRDPQGAARP